MLSETAPKLGLGPSLQRVCSEPDHPKALTGVGARFAGLQEEVDASGRPPDSAGALGGSARSAEPLLKRYERAVELPQVVDSRHRWRPGLSAIGYGMLGGVPP